MTVMFRCWCVACWQECQCVWLGHILYLTQKWKNHQSFHNLIPEGPNLGLHVIENPKIWTTDAWVKSFCANSSNLPSRAQQTHRCNLHSNFTFWNCLIVFVAMCSHLSPILFWNLHHQDNNLKFYNRGFTCSSWLLRQVRPHVRQSETRVVW